MASVSQVAAGEDPTEADYFPQTRDLPLPESNARFTVIDVKATGSATDLFGPESGTALRDPAASRPGCRTARSTAFERAGDEIGDRERSELTAMRRFALPRSGRWIGYAMRSIQIIMRDTVYHAGGAIAIFVAYRFGRWFRDMQTVMRQYRNRQMRFGTVGQALLGFEPGVAMFTF